MEILLQVLEKWYQGHFEQHPHQQVRVSPKLFNGIHSLLNICIYIQVFLLIWKQFKRLDFKIFFLLSILLLTCLR